MERKHGMIRKKEKVIVSRNTRKKGKNKKDGKHQSHTGLYGFLLMCFSVLSGLALISNLMDPADNILGKYSGYYLARILTGLSGNIPALFFPILFFMIGWGLISQNGIRGSFRNILFTLIGQFELGIFLSIRNLGSGRSWEQFYTSGGIIGNFIVQNVFILAFGSQKVGAYIIMTIIILGTLIWGFRVDVYELMMRIRSIVEAMHAFIFDRQAQLAFSGNASAGVRGIKGQGRERAQLKKKFTTEEDITSGTISDVDEKDRDSRRNPPEMTEMTDEEIDRLPVSKALTMRLEKKQREFLNEYSGHVIKEMDSEETSINVDKDKKDEDSYDATIIVDKKKEKKNRTRKEEKLDDDDSPIDLDEVIAENSFEEEAGTEDKSDAAGDDEKDADDSETGQTAIMEEPEEEKAYDEYVIPNCDMIEEHPVQKRGITDEEINVNAVKLIDKLKDFKINGVISEVCPGPVITRYELQLAPGTKVAKVESLSLDLAVAMAVSKIRISLVPGKSAIGVELPNPLRQTVLIKDVLKSPDFKSEEDEIKLTLGKDIAGKPVIVNLVKMPHLLIAGTTGSGKSVCTNSFLASILFSKSPEEVKMILIDPKVVEMTIYNGIPHLLSDVITTPKEAISALKWGVAEMNRRYQLLAKASCRNIGQFNAKVKDGSIEYSKLEPVDKKRMPYIVIIIDELADLMLSVGKELEDEIVRIAQKSRAIGIHLILATQRPEAKVVTGLIKSNMPSRIALMVNSGMDSRIIMDDKGAEDLLGLGDMLYKAVDMREMVRVHGCFIDTFESEKVIEMVRGQNVKHEKIKSFSHEEKKTSILLPEGSNEEIDELKEAARIIVSRRQGSTSLLQRRMSVGYAKAGRLMDQLEAAGIVGPNAGSKAREVLVENEDSIDAYLGEYVNGNNLF